MSKDLTELWTECFQSNVEIQFKQGSTLRQYLLNKKAISHTHSYKFGEVFTALIRIIKESQMFDETQKMMVICNKELGLAVAMRGFHMLQTAEILNDHIIENEDIKKLTSQYDSYFSQKQETELGKKQTVKHKWFKPKHMSTIGTALCIPEDQELTSGGEIAARIKTYIENKNIYENNNKNVCVLKNGFSEIKDNSLLSGLGVKSFHKYHLWEIVMSRFHAIEDPLAWKRNNDLLKKSSEFRPRTSQILQIKQEEIQTTSKEIQTTSKEIAKSKTKDNSWQTIIKHQKLLVKFKSLIVIFYNKNFSKNILKSMFLDENFMASC